MAGDRRGPFDRILRTTEDGEPAPPDRAVIYVGGTILGLALLLLILVLPPVSVLSRGGDGDGEIRSGPADADSLSFKPRNGTPKLPSGLAAASPLYDLAAPEDQRGAARVTVKLKEKHTDARVLGVYSHIDGKWTRLSDAELWAGGEAVRGEVDALPGNVIVLRRSKSLLQVAGFAPAGTQLDETAANVITTLHPIVFIPSDAGGLAGQPPAVPRAGYKVVPAVVAPNAEVVDNIMRSAELRARHATAIADAVREGNFEGINIDYRNVNATLKEQYSAFVDQLASALHEDGRTLTLTLPMPSSNEGAIDTGAYDWQRLGGLADMIEMAGELDQELYFQRTEAALDYVTDQVDSSKIMISVNALSVERGGDGLRAMPLIDALTLASVVGVKVEGAVVAGSEAPLVAQNLAASEGASGMHWDDAARSVTFSYPGRGGKRTVWIANQFSTAFRLELAQRYGLAGITIDNVSSEGGAADIWAPVRELADTGALTLSRPNGDLFTPTWSASEGAITPTSGDAVTWSAPEEAGSYEITVVVSDGVIRAGQRISIETEPAPAPAPTP